ncbi:S46 family peptidase [Sandaracinobacteroides sp. A072]|uniref:S46 family peptidase n=1 Tax=Sandaracinobacteroides sp. A072 TaxID=3461146 RepID=UPI004041E163
MRAHLLLGFALAALPALPAVAAEGMWLPSQAPLLAERLKADGLEIPAAALADLGAAPMNAIASLGGCSASFVSPEGLVATNHHCVYGSIQYNSSPERDLLTNGFLARTRAEELPAAPGARILVIEELRDVTAAVLSGVTVKVTGKNRTDLIDRNRKNLISACEAEAGRRCDVRAYFGGGTWFLQKMLEIRDVRLVHAPAGSVGNYGGEVDNWQWPRHTGDYSFYRAYVAPDGSPAGHDAANVPYRPRAHLKIATSDLKEGDFVMIAGFPGVTERYRTAGETRAYYSDIYPLQQRLLAEHSDLITREAKTDAERIATASLQKRSDNFKKKILGQMEMAAATNLLATKEADDRKLADWAARPANRRTHARAIADYDAAVAGELAASRARIVNQTLDRAQLLRAARDLFRWANERALPDEKRAPGYQDRDRQALIDRLSLIDRQYVARIDGLMLEQALREVGKLPEGQRNLALEKAIAERGLDRLYAGTRLADRAERLAWLDRPVEAFAASDDPFIQVAVAAYAADMMGEERAREREGRLHAARVAYMEAVKTHAASEGRLLYPDANGSLRFTWGKVAGRAIEDGKAWTAFTTTRGLLEKEKGEEPFNAPPALLEKVRAGDWGRWASPALGTLPVNFLSTTDITNGNSGSAVLNARGELVGLAFDGTIEGMLSDWKVDDATNRTIAVDARYMLWVMEKMDGAGHLLEEMGVGPEKEAAAR